MNIKITKEQLERLVDRLVAGNNEEEEHSPDDMFANIKDYAEKLNAIELKDILDNEQIGLEEKMALLYVLQDGMARLCGLSGESE